MAYGQWSLFRGIVWLVLMVFYIQTLNPVMLGYAPPYGAPATPPTEATTGSFGQSVLDWLIPAAQAAEPSKSLPSSLVFVQRDYVPAYAQPQANGDPLLASTPEFDLADPYLVEKANELGKDPQRIFAFVRDQIGFESYAGSLRGARGTLWSNAGNALDKASLLVALLRASNIPAQYVQGTLADSDAQQLILSMFPSPLRVVGCLDPGTQVADPANDPQLLSEARQHYWVRFNGQDADPNFAGAQIGKIFATAQGAFAEVPDNLRHKVTVRLKRELTLPLTGLFGAPPQDIKTVLEKTFTSSELVGKPITIGHFVQSSSTGFLISATTNTYSPYLMVGGNSIDPSNDPLFRGEDYQEVLTNFPFGSQIATGLFVEIDSMDPGRSTKTYEWPIKDRIGKAARESGAVNISISINSASKSPFVTPLDLTTLSFLSTQYAGPSFEEIGIQISAILTEFGNFSGSLGMPGYELFLKT